MPPRLGQSASQVGLEEGADRGYVTAQVTGAAAQLNRLGAAQELDEAAVSSRGSGIQPLNRRFRFGPKERAHLPTRLCQEATCLVTVSEGADPGNLITAAAPLVGCPVPLSETSAKLGFRKVRQCGSVPASRGPFHAARASRARAFLPTG